MKRPQFTAVPHEFIDRHLPELTVSEVKVALVIMRLTYGWNRETKTVSLADLADLTGLSKGSCCDASKALEERGLIRRRLNKSSDGGCSATTYSIVFDDAPDYDLPNGAFADDDTPPVVVAERYKDIENKRIERSQNTPPTPSTETAAETELDEPATFGAWRKLWDKARLPLKQSERKQAEARFADLSIGVAVLERGIPLFAEWAREKDDIQSHVSVFFKDPESWATRRTFPKDEPVSRPQRAAVAPIHQRVDSPDPDSVSVAPAAPEFDAPGIWNAAVTANPYEWNGHAPRKRLAECLRDPVFVEKFPEACRIAQKIHTARGTDAGWISLPWALAPGKDEKPPGWYRLITDLRYMAEPPKPAGPPESGTMRMLREVSARNRAREAERAAAKNLNSDTGGNIAAQ